MVECPACNGTGLVPFLNRQIQCFDCEGAGQIPDKCLAWLEAGPRLRAERLKRGLTVRDEAKRRGIGPLYLFLMEVGRVEPVFEGDGDLE